MRLQHALEELYGLERRKDKLGLEGTRALLGALGDPHTRFRSVHVAGTNGKGSVCALIERVLREAGYRTGLYTSPHLVDFRERIRVDGRWADEERLAERLEHIQSLPEGRDRTFFEVATALAFDDFAARGVEIAVVEVGLGGRLDCTNVITPEVSVITTIDRDHMEILGNTRGQIAAEKAGIIKPGVPVVVAGQEQGAYHVLKRVAAACNAPWVAPASWESWHRPSSGDPVERRFVVIDVEPWGRVDAAVGLLGMQQVFNASVALATLRTLHERGMPIPVAAIRAGLERARWPGRLEPCPTEPRLWWDGAHNNAAFSWMLPFLSAVGCTPGTIILALSRDKDVESIVRTIAFHLPSAHLVATRTRSERALAPDHIVREARVPAVNLAATTAPDVVSACRSALANTPNDSVLLAGSLFAVGEAMEAFGGAPGELL